MKLNHYKLDNGLTVILYQRSKIPVVSINLSYKVGSKYENIGKTGLAHLFEHLMFEGTENNPKGQFDKLCSMAGGSNNAYTTYDWTAYTMTLPKHQLELALWLESDRLFYFNPTQESLTNQINVVTEEIKQTVDNQPYGRWRNYSAAAAYSKECTYSWEVQGLIEDVQSVTMDDVKNFKANHYSPERGYLSIVGDIDLEQSKALVNKYFNNNIENKSLYKPSKFEDKFRVENQHASFEDEVSHNAVFLSFHCPGFIENEEHYTADVYTNLISNGRSSLLKKDLVYSKGIAQEVGAFFDKRENSSLMTFYIIASDIKTNPDELYQALSREIFDMNKLKTELSSMEKTKNSIYYNSYNELTNNYSIADNLSYETMFFGNPERLFNKNQHYLDIKENDIMNFVEKYIKQEKAIRVDTLIAKKS